MNSNQPNDKWFFTGEKGLALTIANTAVANRAANHPGKFREGVVRLTSTDHDLIAIAAGLSGNAAPNLTYVKGTTNYDGIRRIVGVATNTVDIVAPYTAETPAGDGSETLIVGLKFDHDVELVGFDIHLDATPTTEENLEVHIDSDRGAAWDRNIYTVSMNGVQDIVYNFNPFELISARDLLYMTWTNTEATLYGITIETRRVA